MMIVMTMMRVVVTSVRPQARKAKVVSWEATKLPKWNICSKSTRAKTRSLSRILLILIPAVIQWQTPCPRTLAYLRVSSHPRKWQTTSRSPSSKVIMGPVFNRQEVALSPERKRSNKTQMTTTFPHPCILAPSRPHWANRLRRSLLILWKIRLS